MFVNDEAVELLKKILDSCDQTIRENIVLRKMLEQVGVTDWADILKRNLDRLVIASELDEHLKAFRGQRQRLFQLLTGSGPDDRTPPPSGKPH